MRQTRIARTVISTFVTFALYSVAARADLEGVNSFSIPPQSLSAALLQFSSQADVQVVGSTATLANLDTKGVSGQLTGREALRKLLESHALRFEEVTSRSVKILPQAMRESQNDRSADVSGHALMLAQAATSENSSTPAGADSLEEIVVTGKQFNYQTVESANKIPMSVKETPQSIKIITQDMMDFASIKEFEDTYKIDAGSHPSFLRDGFARSYFRGFLADSDSAFKLDGMRAFGTIELDLSALERFEIVKGSTSTMYGHASIGGTLNAISKKPTPQFGGAAELEVGSYAHYRAMFDVHGALTGDEKLSGRLVASYLDEEGAVDFYSNKIKVLAPSLKYQFTDDTSLTLLTQYQDQDFVPMGNFGVQIIAWNPDTGGFPSNPDSYQLPKVPRDRFVGQPDQFFKSQLRYARLLLETKFAEKWNLRAQTQYAKLENDVNQSQGIFTDPDGLTELEMFGGPGTNNIRAAEVNVYGDVTLAGREHTVFLGADYYETKDHGSNGYASLPSYLTGFSIFDPDYSLLPRSLHSVREYLMDNPALAPYTDYAEMSRSRGKGTETGITGQVFLRPADKWRVMLGARYSEYKSGTSRITDYTVAAVFDTPLPPIDFTRQYATTYQTGLTYSINDRVNAYVSYGESFTPRYQELSPGVYTSPEEGTSYEVGLKGDMPSLNFAWSAALFQIARTNITEPNPENPQYVRLLGDQRSRGLELDAQGEVAKGWSVYVSAAAMKNEFAGGQFDGYPSFFAPKLGLSAYSSYQLQGGPAAGLGFGGGVVYKKVVDPKPFFGSARGQTLRLFGDVFEVDARAFYARGPWNYELALTNVLDKKYYSPSYPSPFYAINVNPGRQIMGSLKYSF